MTNSARGQVLTEQEMVLLRRLAEDVLQASANRYHACTKVECQRIVSTDVDV